MTRIDYQMKYFVVLLMIMMNKSYASFLYNNYSSNSDVIFDCFYVHLIDDRDEYDRPTIPMNYLTPYCRRSLLNESDNKSEGSIANRLTFKSLRSQGIRSVDLLQWSISIDLIEQYEIYFQTNDSRFDELIYNNCSLSWFGSHCQYTFHSNKSIQSVSNYVITSFKNRKQYQERLFIHTCYPYLSECIRGPEPMCLDWREICDGKIDCVEGNFGIDEKYCAELELNECQLNEYRCHFGGQCIPIEFFRDGWKSNDCLDGTDEDEQFFRSIQQMQRIPLICIDQIIFACEETTCRHSTYFSCGDGHCVTRYGHGNHLWSEETRCKGTNRDVYYKQVVYSSAKEYPIDCYQLLYCKLKFYHILKNDLFTEKDCLSEDWLLTNNCSREYLTIPLQPLLYGYFQPVYSTTVLKNRFTTDIPPTYICNDRRFCLHLPKATTSIFGLDCRKFQINGPFIFELYRYLETNALRCQFMGNIYNYTSNSSLFYCEQSYKHISKHRLIDGYRDCFHEEDENYQDSCLLNDSQRFNCTSENTCLSPLGIGVMLPDCIGEEDRKFDYYEVPIYPVLCTYFPDFLQEDDETDETHCEWWPCYTPYTRCDNCLQCANGVDELNCSNVNCQLNEYKCSRNSKDDLCIPREYIYEMPLDCNDRNINNEDRRIFFSNSSTINVNNELIRWKDKTCLTEDDICGYASRNDQTDLCPLQQSLRVPMSLTVFTDLYDNETLCYLGSWNRTVDETFFLTYNLGYFPQRINSPLLTSNQSIDTKLIKRSAIVDHSIELIEYCNRGIIIFEGRSLNKKCLCPPSYFGDRCQWQNQRLSLTIQFRTFVSYQRKISIYQIFIYLIDDQNGIIQSYEQITYVPTIDCDTKYNRYLLYRNQPKDPNSKYSIQIDVYDKLSFIYYGRWFLSIPFLFLPVNRIATRLQIPSERSYSQTNCSIQCGNHGECFHFINLNEPFCYCEPGYSGRSCNETYQRSCSLDSIELNSSICLCPFHKFGSKCFLKHQICQSSNTNPCENSGQCIPIDDRIRKDGFICLCNEDYRGSRCQHHSNRIDIHLKIDPIPSVIFAHFITAFDMQNHQRTSTFKKIPFDQNSISLFYREEFHLLFIEFSNQYYLTVVRENSIPSEFISTEIRSENLCLNISQLMNSTLLNYKTLRRLKYYPLQCLQNRQLKCFYDEEYLCVCDQTRFANCFKFNHNVSHNCQGEKYCKNNAECFQDNLKCPSIFVCKCDECYYGSQCQLTTEGFSISLDVIFGYHIKSSSSFSKQSKSVKITSSLTILMFVFGLINGFISISTFRRKSLIQTGCGTYLLINSFVSILTTSVFVMKYSQLIVFQSGIITNRSFIYLNCALTDFILKILLSYGDWLNASVAIERTITAIQGVRFSQSKSKSIAKSIPSVILILTTLSYLHDPVSRKLFDDENEQRTWCILNYSTSLKIFDRLINLFHFLTPFIINFFSAIIIINQVFRMRAKVNKKSSNQTLLHVEIKRHKHLLISPVILILLAFPRLIIQFISRCMKSARDPWVFLIGYYISFLPPLLIFPIFILPSEKYKEEFLSMIKNINLRR